MEKKKTEKPPVPVKELTSCDATAQMLEKARRDGVETAFDRALNMKACPIGADSACCKHCSMGPCRLNAKDPYGKVGVCGATIDTIQARNFARMVASGAAAHTDHGMAMVDLKQSDFAENARTSLVTWTARTFQRWNTDGKRLPSDLVFVREQQFKSGATIRSQATYTSSGYDDLISRGNGLVWQNGLCSLDHDGKREGDRRMAGRGCQRNYFR